MIFVRHDKFAYFLVKQVVFVLILYSKVLMLGVGLMGTSGDCQIEIDFAMKCVSSVKKSFLIKTFPLLRYFTLFKLTLDLENISPPSINPIKPF